MLAPPHLAKRTVNAERAELADHADHAGLAADLPAWQLRTTLALMRAALRNGNALDDLLARHPALHETLDQAAAAGLAELTLDEALQRLDRRLGEDAAPSPLQGLRHALRLDAGGLGCFIAAAWADAEPALSALVDELHGQQGRPTRATLARAFGAATAAAAVQRLCAAGALQESGPVLVVPRTLWEMACGLPPSPAAFLHEARASLPTLGDLVLPTALLQALDAAPVIATARCWLLRGSPGSGRHALAGALAQAQGLGLVQAVDEAHARALGAAAALLGALPLVTLQPAPGETLSWALPTGAPGCAAARLPRHGALQVAGAETLRLDLPAPDAAERRAHWALALGRADPPADLVALRLPRGALHRAARRVALAPADLLGAALAAVEEQGHAALDGIARRVAPAAHDEPFALPESAREEFDALVTRCRHRDALAAALPAAYGQTSGVRALFKGPSGTGKTLAARHLAAALRRPLYRVDLAATISKYIGETERNLERVFEAAESLDIVLLLDEGDALLAGRTGVANATDRYANLETNYLLQRLEHYEGVLVVTTNAAERIDGAFARRMDVSIEFPLPDAETRLALWHAHLPAGHHIDGGWLERVALRCALSGGQVRNAALVATLLAVETGVMPGVPELCRALEREYRKTGQHAPSLDDD